MKSSAPPPRKKRNVTVRIDDIAAEELLSADEVAIVFSFLLPKDIMRARVCTTWRDAAKKTIVPLTDFQVYDVRSYNAMRAMSTALPNLQQLRLLRLRYFLSSESLRNDRYTDGEDPDEVGHRYTTYYRTHDIFFISNFSKLRILKLDGAPLNGRYPILFNFPLLEQLNISNCLYLKWDLEMLSGCPLLKELDCEYPTGNLSSLRVLKNTLEKMNLSSCHDVWGNIMDLADFPRLRRLDLQRTSVTGDIRDIRTNDFPAIEKLILPETVVGGKYYEFQHISDVPIFMQSIHHLLQRNPTLFEVEYKAWDYTWLLSPDSPDWYDRDWDGDPPPPFYLDFIQAGQRLGWSWLGTIEDVYENIYYYCEVNWLDPEPSSDSSDYEAYMKGLQWIKQLIEHSPYKGYHEPPTEEQYRRICVDVAHA